MTDSRRRGLALLVLCMGLFVILLDTTIVNVAIPSMIDSFHASLDQMLWTVNAYLLAFAVLLITGGRLGDILGSRNLFTVGLGIFSVASALNGIAQSPGQMIVARVLQGVGAALLTPQTLVIISGTFPADRRGAAFGILSGMAGLAALSGPTVGGLLVTYVNWRWIFFVNVPIGMAGVLLAFWFVPNIRAGTHHRLDLLGVFLASAGIFCVIFTLIEGQRYDWGQIAGSWLTIPDVCLAGAALLAGFVVWEHVGPEPLLPLSLFRNRSFSVTVWLNGLMGFALLGMLLVTTLDMQTVLGMTALQAGLTSTPLTICLTIVAPFAGRITDRIGGRSILAFGFALYAVGIAGVAVAESVHATSWTFTVPLAIAGLGMGCVYAPLTTVAMREVDAEMAGAAAGILNTARQIGSALGSTVVGAVLLNRLKVAVIRQASAASTRLPVSVRERFVHGISHATQAGLGLGTAGNGVHWIPDGVSPQFRLHLERLIHEVFTQSYATAMRATLEILAAALVLGVITSLLVEHHQPLNHSAGADSTESHQQVR